MSAEPRRWRLAVDTGGTFTDLVGTRPDGSAVRCKVLSRSALRGAVRAVRDPTTLAIDATWARGPRAVEGLAFRPLGSSAPGVPVAGWDPGRGELRLERQPASPPVPGAPFELLSDEPAPLLAARLATDTPAGARLPPAELRCGTTVVTNALLTGRVVPAALLVTRGFADLLDIGTQQRDDLFSLRIVRRRVPCARTIEIAGRLDRSGHEREPLDEPAVIAAADELAAAGIRDVGVCLLHADRDPRHERRVAELLAPRGFRTLVLSSELAPRLGLLVRATTTLVEACTAPLVRDLLDRIADALGPAGRLLVSTSAGGLVPAARVRAAAMLLSGPAGGVVGALEAGRRAGERRVLALDMGGTSTDVSRPADPPALVAEHAVGPARLALPALEIETVAAGGGSICAWRGGRLAVGPESAGAHPGPACYGEGGPLTLTDVNLLAGRLDPDALGIPLDPRAARDRLDDLVEQIAGDLGTRPDPDEVLDGLLEIANLRMADAIRAISIRRGHDPRGDTLVAFGGAGGQHACAIAERLGLRRVLVPPDAGLLSACGLAAAPVERIAERQVLARLDAVIGDLDRLAAALEREARDTLRRETGRGDATAVDRRLSVRFAGQGDALDVPLGRGVDPVQEFLARYRALYGHLPAGRALEAVAVRVVARAAGPRAAPPARHDAETAAHVERAPRRSGRTLRMRAGGTIHEAPVLDRAGLAPGEPCTGPAIVVEPHGTTVVEPGWTLAVDASTGALRLARDRRAAPGPARSDLVAQELFVHRLEQVAREMGEALRRTAVSTNVRERLDYSCAVLDRDGRLLANAPHIPVHLGSLGMCVRSVDAALGGLAPGEFAVTNHPAHGGSHLPDVTVILAVGDGGGRRIGFAATRAHHAEIGGRLPGSMPPTARRLAEEGVVIPPTRLGTVDAITTDGLRRLFVAGPWPSRCPDDNVADLEAAIAACHRGGEALAALARGTGTRRFEERAARLRAHAARLAARALARIPPGPREATEVLDSGARLTVRWEIDAGRARITFPDAPPLDPGSLNATPAIVASTVIYVLRVMVDEPLPLNEGLLERVDLVIPPGMLAPEFPEDPAQAPAVVGGNVELSQRLVDASLRALGLCAASQGTMNNVLFGDAGFSYYETIGGGAGAGPDFDGASAVQVHMTNTRITDPEVLEHRHPAAVRRFAVRRGSGGAGRRRGGDGIVRELEFLAPLTLSVLGEHRVRGPSGERGGADGAPARVALHRARGPVQVLRSADAAEVGPGDRLVVETPGGGGWGAPE